MPPGNLFKDRRSLIVPIIVILHVVLDRLTKEWIRNYHLGDVIGHIGSIRIVRIQNSGSAFGLFQGQSTPLMILASVGVVVLVGVLFWVYRKIPQVISIWNLVAFSLVLGGAIGNLIDRITEGGMVTDFIDPGFWPAFNAAVSGISIGGVMIAISLLLYAVKSGKEENKG